MNNIIKKNEFICDCCQNVYEKGWSDEEAEEECIENFVEEAAHGDDRAIVCDDCYKMMMG